MEKTLWLAVVLAAAGAGSGAFAQDHDDGGPGRGVARMSVINGDVSVRRGDSGDWIAAAPNAPLVVGDRVFTGPASRAEVQFDYANMIRLNDNTEIRLSELEYLRYQIQVAGGTAMFRVLRDSQAETELSTPSVSVRPVRRGEYRVTVFADGSSEITVRSGEAEIYTPRGVERLAAGRTMRARGPASDPEFQIARAIPEDDFDRWNERRDRDLNRSRSYQYVSRDIYGAEDLDAYGSWIYVPPYGWVWSPRASAGWAPYRYGRWTWIDWYGWSWVSYDPWGWAPYHYGRWFYHGSRWCWYPGAVYHRHYWRPALVAFFGWGSHGGVHVGVGFGWGNVGWVPLAPYEPYYPWYGHRYYRSYRGGDYVDNSVHIVNNTNITNIYRNSRVDNAITAVNAGDFTRGRAANLVRVSGGDLRSVGLVKGVVPVAPERESLRVADREVNRAVLARNTENGEGRFFSRRQPAPVERASFDEQRRGVEQIARRSFGETRGGEVSARETGVRGGGSEERGVRRAGEAVERRDNPAAGGVEGGTRTSERGWRRVGETTPRAVGQEAPASGSSEGASARTSERGWRRVGETAPRAVGQQNPGAGSSEGANARTSDGWRRFGGRGASDDANRESGIRSRTPERNQTVAPAAPDPGSASRSSDGWRRFGGRGASDDANRESGVRSRTPERNQTAVPAAPDPGSASRSSDGWRRFERSEAAPPGRDTRSRAAPGDGWRSFGPTRSEASERPGSGASENSSRSDRVGGSGRESGENGWRSFGGRGAGSESRPAGSQQPVRINPPIVRERSAPGSEYRSGGSESYRMRSWDAPERSLERPRYEAPSRNLGGQAGYESPSRGSYGGGSPAVGGRSYGGQPRAESPARGSYGGGFGGAAPSGGGRSSGMSGGGARGGEGRVSGRGR